MAKKKKIAANPARGFATVSVASKPKVEKQSTESDLLPAAEKDADGKQRSENTTPGSASTPSKNPADDSSAQKSQAAEKDLSELTPGELEARLEETEVQAFVDKFSARCVRDASRHVAKLQTERRLLRKQGQAQKLFVRGALGEELIDAIVQLARDEVNDGLNAVTHSGMRTVRKKEEVNEEEALVLLWTLQRALLSLGFDESRVQDALNYALKHMLHQSGSNASLWAFEECLDWLTLNLDENELPDLELHAEKPRKGLLDTGTETPSVSSEQSDADDSESTMNLPNVDDPGLVEHIEAPPQGAPSEENDAVSDLESDLEPEELLSVYLETKARLYEVQPDLVDKKKPKGQSGKKSSTSKIGPKTARATALFGKLQKIESDLLFDQDVADDRWVIKRNQVAQNVAERRKLGLLKAPEALHQSKFNERAQSTTGQTTPMSTEGSELANDSDDDGALGALFSSIPSNEHDQNSTEINHLNDSAGNGNITIRDFGKSSGISPRRVLEEACRARDSRVQLIYKSVSLAAFSNRQSLTIRWSKLQIVPFPVMLKSVPSSSDSESCTFVMNTVATPDSRQSESYVSVVALFQIFSSSAKEEKVYLRLPAAWRDLWFELVAQHKRDIEQADKETVRSLRSLYKLSVDQQHNSEEQTFIIDRDGQNSSKEKGSKEKDHPAHETSQSLDEQRIKEIWETKSSAPSYQNMLPGRMSLPIFQFRDAALAAIEEHQVTIICGETGCGKSTQMPAFILEHAMKQGKDCKIYCTEPRRISAITLAQRVSQEFGEAKSDLGTARSLIGYAIRLESRVSASTRLVYATTGIVLRMLESEDALKDVTHVVIDEVHERSIETDFLLIILRTLTTKRPDLRVILMSATVDADRFSKYFNGSPILNVPGRTFPVDTRFLEDAVELTGHVLDDNGQGGHDEEDIEEDSETSKNGEDLERLSQYSPQTRQTLKSINEYRIDFALIASLITQLCSDSEYQQYSKAILVFLPGIAEIRQLSDMIHGTPLSQRCVIHSLHSAIPSEDQQRAFQPPPRGMKKIVISTNIAETGVTIPDVTCVIDTGKHKEMRFDERRQISRLIESFISRANAKQRRGRAGRVQAGICFHLFTRSRHERSMAEEQTPEMLRLSLQDLIMRVKICKLGDIQSTLASALDPPSAKNIRRAIDALIEVGALTSKEDLTPLGQQLSKLPLDPYLGKLVLYGAIFGALDIAITLAAILTSKSPFVTPINGRQQAVTARTAFSKGDSDLLTDFNAYSSWRRVCQNSPTSEFSFCRKNLLSSQTLANIEDLKAQLLSSLTETGLIHLSPSERASTSRVSNSGTRTRRFTNIPDAHTSHADNLDLASALIASAFYPKLLARDGKGWRNVATNQAVSLHPTSVLRATPPPPTTKYLSFYSILQASGGARNYNATSLTPAAPLFLALLAGDAAFHPVAHVVSLDGARVRFCVDDESAGACWRAFVALKFLRRRLEAFVGLRFGARARARDRERDGGLEKRLGEWMRIWEALLEKSAGR